MCIRDRYFGFRTIPTATQTFGAHAIIMVDLQDGNLPLRPDKLPPQHIVREAIKIFSGYKWTTR
eukprot:283387-Amphidinium_carterae.1